VTLHLCYYHGRSCISRLIEAFTWGPISHVAVRDPETGCVWEAWQGGVKRSPSISTLHTERTQVDVYAVDLTDAQHEIVTGFLEAQVGRPYDYRGIASFLLRINVGKTGAWFCSELAQAAFAKASIMLLRCQPFKATPTMLSYSPVPRWLGKEWTA
jgi:uncharacterized protein YycO